MNGTLVVALIVGIFGAGGGGAVWLGRVMPQRISSDDKIDKLEQKVAALETKHAADLTALETKHSAAIQHCQDQITAERQDRRALEDYVEELRMHISNAKPPPPPPWPEGLRL